MSNLSADSRRRIRAAQRDAGSRRARSLRCPRCERQNALSAQIRMDDGWKARECRYCGHAVGIIDGKTFGYDVTPEPGVRK